MKKGLTELVFILDKSGSMGGLETDTIRQFLPDSLEILFRVGISDFFSAGEGYSANGELFSLLPLYP